MTAMIADPSFSAIEQRWQQDPSFRQQLQAELERSLSAMHPNGKVTAENSAPTSVGAVLLGAEPIRFEALWWGYRITISHSALKHLGTLMDLGQITAALTSACLAASVAGGVIAAAVAAYIGAQWALLNTLAGC